MHFYLSHFGRFRLNLEKKFSHFLIFFSKLLIFFTYFIQTTGKVVLCASQVHVCVCDALEWDGVAFLVDERSVEWHLSCKCRVDVSELSEELWFCYWVHDEQHCTTVWTVAIQVTKLSIVSSLLWGRCMFYCELYCLWFSQIWWCRIDVCWYCIVCNYEGWEFCVCD